MLKRQPAWIPEFVWSGYQEIARVFDDDTYGFGIATARAARTLVADPNCAPVWRAMARRATSSESDQTKRFFLSVGSGVLGPHPTDTISTDERKSRGKRIARLASELRSELAHVCLAGDVPSELDECFHEMEAAIGYACAHEERGIFSLWPIPEEDRDAFAECLSEVAMRVGYTSPDEEGRRQWPFLLALEKGAAAWSKSRREIYRPNDPNSACQYLALKVAGHFQWLYGTPLLDATSLITSSLFPPGMSKDAVSQLLGRRKKRVAGGSPSAPAKRIT